MLLVLEYGPDEFIKRIADPAWFQSLGTVLAFDWNASGLTTILTAALKEAIRGEEKDLGIFICGGKGKTSRKTPDEIRTWGERLSLSAPQAEKSGLQLEDERESGQRISAGWIPVISSCFFLFPRRSVGGCSAGDESGKAFGAPLSLVFGKY